MSVRVLLVEDEATVRQIVGGMLVRLGYTLLDVPDAASALDLAANHKGPIHLVLTDIVMPQVSGPQLARQLKNLRGDMKVLFMSGYMDDEFHGIAKPERNFIQKPFTATDLAEKLRGVLAADEREA